MPRTILTGRSFEPVEERLMQINDVYLAECKSISRLRVPA